LKNSRKPRRSTPGEAGDRNNSFRHWPLVVIGVLLLVLDQLLKKFFTAHSYESGLVSLHILKNTGMSFGLLQGRTIIMIIVSILFLALLWFFRKEFRGCGWCLMFLVVGTIGNLIDRVFRGYVVDFVDLGWFPVFNLSDALITIGVAGIVIVLLLQSLKERKEGRSGK
jgi:signal peptidase II